MPATIHRMPAPPRREPAPAPRKPITDNPRLIVIGIVLLLAALAGILVLADRSARLSPAFLTEFVLYALSAADLTMLAALLFVLARNVIKLVVERRRGLPFARFRAKLVMVLLGMTFVPAVLVLLTGSELIRSSVERWFNAPMDEILTSATKIAADFYQDRQNRVSEEAARLARALESVPANPGEADVAAIREQVAAGVKQQRVQMVQVYRVDALQGAVAEVRPIVDIAAPALPRGYDPAIGERLAAKVAAGSPETHVEEVVGQGRLIRAAAAIRPRPNAPPTGVVVASDYLTGDLAARSLQITKTYEAYKQAQVLKNPLAGVYLSFFLMITLLILVSATWMGLYLAKRITRPVQMLAAAAKEIGAGHLDHRMEPETRDEFGSLVEAFNTMAGELAASRRKLERSAVDLERKHVEVEERRRYMETILERVATGVVSVDAAGRVGTVNSAAERLLGLGASSAVGQPASAVFGAGDLQSLGAVLRDAAREGHDARPQEVTIVREGRELHLAAMATVLHGDRGGAEGMVLVVDDVTPLIRAQKVAAWRDVARRLAHEIKNPLTPIQLSADRLRRHFAAAAPATRALVEECTHTIAGEVESLKALVDEFSQFARMPPPRTMPTDVHTLIADTLALYNGLFHEVALVPRFAAGVPAVRVDPEQIRRVLINLIDNALEAMERRGEVVIETQHDPVNGVARIIVADNGPGIPPGEREKLFLPYYSTKRRGSGLGLAIVRRIIAEHGGSIDVGDNAPRGTRFVIELPC